VVEPNECNLLRIALANKLGGIISGVNATLSTTNAGVTVTQPFSPYPNLPAFGTRSNMVPFQISTSPTMICGTILDLVLTVTTATNGHFRIPFVLHTGGASGGQRFDNAIDLPLADAGSVDSLISVAGFNGILAHVSVSLHITHTSVGDLDISLIAPDGTTIDLSSDNGGTSDDYGTSEADVDRTFFVDTGASSITAGNPPFRGTFRPEQPLALLRGKSGAAVNGTWRLRINDDTAGSVGTLRAWMLNLSAAFCRPGGGECEQCGGPIIGSITGSDLRQASRLFLDGNASDCSAIGACPGQSGAGMFRYDAYTFTNAGPDSCVTVTLESPCTTALNRISSAAYLGGYNPANKCANYLADLGGSPPLQTSYSFLVPSNSAFLVIVNETSAGGGCTNYTLNVTGFDCPQVLGIEALPASRVRLTWSTSAAAYQLMSDNSLSVPSAPFVPVTTEPVVVSGKYAVTNPISGTARFFELRKP
jgi:subtilisin-like proprotein convertase family protein